MSEHINSSIKRDRRRTKYLISPISKIDGEIILNLIEALEIIPSTSLIDSLGGILRNWKLLKDESVLDDLIEWNEVNKPEEGEEHRLDAIEFEGEIIFITNIVTISKFEEFNVSQDQMEYSIVINKDLPDRLGLADKYFNFNSFDFREKRYKDLKIKLSKYIKIIGVWEIINKVEKEEKNELVLLDNATLTGLVKWLNDTHKEKKSNEPFNLQDAQGYATREQLPDYLGGHSIIRIESEYAKIYRIERKILKEKDGEIRS